MPPASRDRPGAPSAPPSRPTRSASAHWPSTPSVVERDTRIRASRSGWPSSRATVSASVIVSVDRSAAPSCVCITERFNSASARPRRSPSRRADSANCSVSRIASWTSPRSASMVAFVASARATAGSSASDRQTATCSSVERDRLVEPAHRAQQLYLVAERRLEPELVVSRPADLLLLGEVRRGLGVGAQIAFGHRQIAERRRQHRLITVGTRQRDRFAERGAGWREQPGRPLRGAEVDERGAQSGATTGGFGPPGRVRRAPRSAGTPAGSSIPAGDRRRRAVERLPTPADDAPLAAGRTPPGRRAPAGARRPWPSGRTGHLAPAEPTGAGRPPPIAHRRTRGTRDR